MTGYGRTGDYAYIYGRENGELMFLKIATEGKQLYKFEKGNPSIYNILDSEGEQFLGELLKNRIKKEEFL